MSYQVLARKWRPQSFKEMVGQEHVLKALIHSLDQKRLHHAYLFTGTRGVGKTTIGRILAKCLNCEASITSVPCGQCDTCREITEGRFVDLIEIDAASRTKVEDMRELLDNVQYAPTRGRFKVYLIDEVHMLSSSSFNALLKTLEEPPEHVKFLFATTDPQKLPVTILSRCLQFNLKNMPPEKIVNHLKHVLTQEQISFEDSALWLLARSADGSMRDALSLTDQAIAYGHNNLTEREVSAMLGSIDQKQVYRIIEAVANLDARQVLAEVTSLAEFSPDYSSVLANIISVLHRVAIEQAVPESTDNSMGDQQQIVELARALSAEDVQLFYQVALVGRSDLPISPDQRAGLEMVLLRMLAFQPNVGAAPMKLQLQNSEVNADIPPPPSSTVPVESQIESPPVIREPVIESPVLQAPEAVVHQNVQPQEVAPASGINDIVYDESFIQSQEAGAVEQDLDLTQKKTVESITPSVELDAKPVVELAPEPVVETLSTDNELPVNELPVVKLPQTEPPVVEQAKSVVDDPMLAGGDIQSFLGLENPWPHILPILKLTGMTQNLASNTSLKLTENSVALNAAEGTFRLLNDTHRSRITEAFKQQFGDAFRVEFIMGSPEIETPSEWKGRKKQERLTLAISAIESDPNVVSLVNRFDATILQTTVEPIDL